MLIRRHRNADHYVCGRPPADMLRKRSPRTTNVVQDKLASQQAWGFWCSRSAQENPQARLNMWCGVSRQTRLVHMTVWALLEECTGQLDEPFRRSEIVGWFRRHHPEVNEATLGAHIQAATENAANRAANNSLGARPALLRRIEHGLYMRADPIRDRAGTAAEEPPRGHSGSTADIILIGCVRTKLPTPAPAAELFHSPLFAGGAATPPQAAAPGTSSVPSTACWTPPM